MTTASAPPKTHSGPRRRPRNVRTTEVIGWFVGVFCAYWIYWLIAVPLIEPGIEPETVSRHTASANDTSAPDLSQRKQALAKYFPPGSWELDNPAVWETDHSMLLFKDLEPQPNNKVKIPHFTLLFFPNEATAAAEPRPIIMRAEHGALLEFDRPIELKTIDRNVTLVGGQLLGRIRIERLPSQPGAGDDLLITTRDIVLKGDRATSPHPVNFRMGRSTGTGRDLEIQLQNDGKPGGALRTGKVKSLLLKRDVIVNLALDDPAFSRNQRPGAAGDLAGSTLRVTCQGHFQYDFELHAAAFHDRVDVARMSKGPSDLLNCELLSIFFRTKENSPAPEPPADPSATAAASHADSPIRRIEARGEPVTLQSPSRGIYVQSLHGLDFEPIPGDQMGRIVGLGQGVMQGLTPGDQANKFLVRWTREFRFEPTEGGQYVASLHGGASVRMPNFGEITANDRLDAQGKLIQEGEIFAWATPVKSLPASDQVAIRPVSLQNGAPNPQPAKPPSDKWQIDRLLAQGSVVVSTPQLDANTGKIEVWVERPTPTTPAAASLTTAPTDVAPPPSQAKPKQSLAPGTPPGQRYSVHAGNVQVKLIPKGEEFAVASLTLENQAHLEELNPKPGAKPMVVNGDRLHVTNADSEQTRVTVAAQPGNLAHIDAGGMVLFGQAIELEKHTNRLWVDGPGRMVMPIAQDLNGQPLAQPQTAEITWQRGMRFQSNTVIFEGDVRIKSDNQFLSTPTLEGVLDRPIDFSNPQLAAPPGAPGAAQNAPQLAVARCRGEALLTGRQVDDKGQQTAIYEMKTFDLEIQRQSGDVRGRGPGHVHYVALAPEGGGNAFALPGQPKPAAGVQPSKLPYTCIHTTFERELSGNINSRTMTFSNATKTAYAPVANWNVRLDAEKPASLGPDGMVLDADQLTVRQMPPRVRGEQGWFELMAEKNVLVEGATFVAVGHRAMYSQDKNQLILEGDGQSPALLTYTPAPGGPRTTTRVARLIYSLGTQHVQITGTSPINIEAPRPAPRPPAKPPALPPGQPPAQR